MRNEAKKIIVILGPTASGKTGIGVKLAKKFDGEIISADSRQVYRGLDIGTGKEGNPWQGNSKNQHTLSNQLSNSKKQLDVESLRSNLRFIDDIPQWLINICEPGEKFSLFDWLAAARLVIEDMFARGKVPIIVGGTGLYIQGLIEGFGLEENPDSFKSDRMSRAELSTKTALEMCDILQKIDPDALETIDQNNPRRLIRAIERAQEGIKTVKIKPDFEVCQIGIDLPRGELYERIDKRVDDRFDQGMLEEVVSLLKSGVDSDWLQGLGLEYREITGFVVSNIQPNSKGQIEIAKNPAFAAMSQQLKWKIHQFARRQLTWFRRFPEIKWLFDYEEIESSVKDFLEK